MIRESDSTMDVDLDIDMDVDYETCGQSRWTAVVVATRASGVRV